MVLIINIFDKIYENKASIQEKIVPALEILKQLLEENDSGSFYSILIDADKINYMNYYHSAIDGDLVLNEN